MKSLKQTLIESINEAKNPNLSVISRINAALGTNATVIPAEMTKIFKTKEYKWLNGNKHKVFRNILPDKASEDRIIGGFIHWLSVHADDFTYSNDIEQWMDIVGMTEKEDARIETLSNLYEITNRVYGVDPNEYLE